MPQTGLSYKITSVVNVIDNFTEVIGKVISWLTLLMVILTFIIVVMRYGLNIGFIAMQESVLYFHGLVFMLGAAYTLKTDGHVRVDIFYQNFSNKKKALVNLLGSVFFIITCLSFYIFY